MNASTMRNIGLLLAIALVVWLVHKHMQTVPAMNIVGGAFSQETDDAAGDSGGSSRYNDQFNMVAGNPNY